MKTKFYDVEYCGVRKKKILTARPKLDKENLTHLYRFITERYNIHLLKDVDKKDPPWTEDEVLKNYRFTNVRREHDKETKWLIKNITSNPDLCYVDKLLNCILFRLFNKHETAELISMPIEFSKNLGWDPEQYRDVFESWKDKHPHETLFTGAFNTGGLKRALKWYLPFPDPRDNVELRVMWFMKYLMNEDITGRIKACANQSKVCEELSSFMGIGPFLSYQIFVDMTYIKEFPFSENEFTVAGPGCKRGLRYLFKDTDGMTYEECLFWLRDNIDRLFADRLGIPWNPDELFRDLPEWDRHMNVMSLENCFCELSKYIRAKTSTGRPRKVYGGGNR